MANALPPHYVGSSADGKIVIFTTTEPLVPSDTDNKRDIYMRSFDPSVGESGEYVTREISTGPTGGNDAQDATFGKVSADGTKVFFTTAEPLVKADTDQRADVYVHDLAKGTSLVSVGQGPCEGGCGNPSNASFASAAVKGDEVFFETAERLVESDKDNAIDVYERNLTTETTTLVSAGEAACAPACGNEEAIATLRDVSGDGNRAFFITKEPLSTADKDTALDIYARDLPNGPTELVSQGESSCQPACGNDSEEPPVFAGSSADGSKVFFDTSEGLVSGDHDDAKDIYERAGETTTLISGGGEDQPANFKVVSEAGDRVLFVTSEALDGGADTNGADDVYEWAGGAPILVTSGTCTQGSECGVTFEAAPADATKVLFTTTERLSLEDSDSSADVYEQDIGGGTPTLTSIGESGCAPCGNGEAAHFNATSTNGLRVIFTTTEQLSTEDSDNTADVYGRDVGAGETLLLTPSGYCPVEKSECASEAFVGASSDGTHVFFQTLERLTLEDGDFESDIYEREFGGEERTHLVSTGNSPGIVLGPPPPVLERTDPESPGVSTEPRVIGHAQAGLTVRLYTTADCSGVPAATGTAAELEAPGIAVAVAEGATTSFRAMATDEGGEASGCSAGAVSYRQETPPPPPPPPGSEEPKGGGGGGTGTVSGSVSGSTGTQGNGRNAGVVYVTPEALITFGPSFKTKKHKVMFRFADGTGQPGTSFLCRIDRNAWHGCTSPQKLKRLGSGKHVFKVKAVNAVGTWEEPPVKRMFKVVGR
jgi:hypothetical protein